MIQSRCGTGVICTLCWGAWVEELLVRGLVALLTGAFALIVVVMGRKSRDYKLSLGGIAMLAISAWMAFLPVPAFRGQADRASDLTAGDTDVAAGLAMRN